MLLVEDNKMYRDMLSHRLERKGFEVVVAVDGRQGVDMSLAESPDLIIMDMSLPVRNGWTATAAIKDNSSTTALTAHAMSGDREKALSAGCDDYDTRPVELPRLPETIDSFLNTDLEG
jgi:CheY-like chemotaxis protein